MTLENDALRLAELDQMANQLIMKKTGKEFFRVLDEYKKLRTSVRHRMLDEGAVSTENPEARMVLRKIDSGEWLQADRFVRCFGEITENSDLAAFGELNDAEVEELGSDLFYHYEYVKALDELRLLIPECDASPTVDRLVKETRLCYAFQQYDAATTMCRALLEAAMSDVCERLGRRSSGYGKTLRKEATRALDIEESFKKRLKCLYDAFCRVAHAKGEATPQQVRKDFHETLSAIEELYVRLAKKVQSDGV